MRRPTGLLGLAGLLAGGAVVAWAHVSLGGDLRLFMQPEAIAVVFGGTTASLLLSFSAPTLAGTVAAIWRLAWRRAAPLDLLVPTFMRYASIARRQGQPAVEQEAAREKDDFLARALTHSVSGLPVPLVREALDVDARRCAERDENPAHVLEAAAGYAPTLGIVGAVLGLMRVMEHFSTSGGIGHGIAAAFVSTIYGLAAANLLFLPLATRVRARGRADALRRELIVDGVIALREGASPRLVEERLAGYLHDERPSKPAEAA
jgi:chemotaxis protein MotA